MTKRNKLGRIMAASLVASVSLTPLVEVHGAFVKLGPFIFDATTRLEAVATTNVEQERPSEATAEREDFYLIWALDLKSTTDLLYRSRLTIDTGIAIEEHFNRPDLNNSEAPFGRFNAQLESDFDPLRLNAGTRYERTSESIEDKFSPVGRGVTRKKRQVGDSLEYTAGAKWMTDRLQLGWDWSFLQERYDDVDFKPEEQDEETITYFVYLKLATIRGIGIGGRYQVEYSQTDLINIRGGRAREEKTETVTLDFDTLELWERPQITYSIGVQREYVDGRSDGWELVHTLSIRDEFELSPVLRLKGSASYSYEDNPEEEDIAFQYNVILEHDVSRRTTQSLSFTREPVDTLGANEDTDTTTFAYNINIADFVIPNVMANGSVSYEINRPVGSDTERIWIYGVGLTHSVPINARLTRQIAYRYSLEDSDQESELLEEHRITLSYILAL